MNLLIALCPTKDLVQLLVIVGDVIKVRITAVFESGNLLLTEFETVAGVPCNDVER